MTGVVSNKIQVFSPYSNPYGVSYPEWTARWWKWILSFPIESSPAKDESGDNCSLDQHAPVWFLAGTLGGVASRRCVVPEGLAILFPVLNHGGTLADEPGKSEEELVVFTRTEMDIISDLEVVIDGVKLDDLKDYRVCSPVFDVVLPKNSLFGGRAGPTRGVSDGYWVFLMPLSKGNHTVHSIGSCSAGRVTIGVECKITIQ
jgi:hypothetical protein